MWSGSNPNDLTLSGGTGHLFNSLKAQDTKKCQIHIAQTIETLLLNIVPRRFEILLPATVKVSVSSLALIGQ